MTAVRARSPDPAEGARANAQEEIRIDYVNYRGERAVRRVVPERCYLGEVQWHPGEQWILEAWDLDKGAKRSFAIADIERWEV